MLKGKFSHKKAYIPGVDSYIFAKRCYNNKFSEKLVNGIHGWIDNPPNVTPSPNVSDSIFFK